ncbi:hypothetical protein FCN45_22235 (plasmid) [Pantoea sp. SO10]|nr:hypothetical protein FCN45_22235 [Pantoea sp. SO10]
MKPVSAGEFTRSAFKSSGLEISESDLALYKEVAKQLFEMTSEQAKVAINTGKMREVKCDG